MGWSWELWGRSWGGLEVVLGDLGASRGGPVEACCCSLIFDRFWVRFWTDLWAQKAPKLQPNRKPKRSKIDAKIQYEKVLVLGPSWSGPRPGLVRVRVHLGLESNIFSVVFKRTLKISWGF